jgi:putative component of toxin-antitoxin plasmid stabilization module
LGLTPVRVTPRFKKLYSKKPEEMKTVIDGAVTQLRVDPRHNGLHTHRVWGAKGVWEARLDKGNRLTFHWDGDTIVLRAHCNHEILKKP